MRKREGHSWEREQREPLAVGPAGGPQTPGGGWWEPWRHLSRVGSRTPAEVKAGQGPCVAVGWTGGRCRARMGPGGHFLFTCLRVISKAATTSDFLCWARARPTQVPCLGSRPAGSLWAV